MFRLRYHESSSGVITVSGPNFVWPFLLIVLLGTATIIIEYTRWWTLLAVPISLTFRFRFTFTASRFYFTELILFFIPFRKRSAPLGLVQIEDNVGSWVKRRITPDQPNEQPLFVLNYAHDFERSDPHLYFTVKGRDMLINGLTVRRNHMLWQALLKACDTVEQRYRIRHSGMEQQKNQTK